MAQAVGNWWAGVTAWTGDTIKNVQENEAVKNFGEGLKDNMSKVGEFTGDAIKNVQESEAVKNFGEGFQDNMKKVGDWSGETLQATVKGTQDLVEQVRNGSKEPVPAPEVEVTKEEAAP